MFSIRSKLSKGLSRFSYNLYHSAKFSSAQNETNSSVVEESNKFKEKIIHTKIKTKLPSRKPLAKNFFLGNVDKDLLSFPEVISRDDMSKLYGEIESIKYCFQNIRDNDVNVREEIINDLKNVGLLGLNVPQNYDGKEYFWSESLIASQFEIQETNIALFLLPHRIVCDVINTHGTEQQKEKYLSKLANGLMIGTDAILESNNENNQFFSTIADFDVENDLWTLKGEKLILQLYPKLDVLLVLAETPRLDSSGISSKGITLFIVDAAIPGIKIGETSNSFGYTTVKFENVHLNSDNVIGKVNEASQAAQLLLQNHRIRSSYVGFGLMKNLINNATKYIIETKYCGVELKNIESVTTYLSKILCNTYAVESMIYFTAGLMDEFENQDTEMETAMIKLHTLNCLWNASTSIMDFMGAKYVQPGQRGENDVKNIIQLYTQGESIDSLKLFISLTGLRHAGMLLHENVNKQRNPLFHPGHMINKFFQSTSIEAPRTKMLLNELLHPSLEPASQCLEHSIYRLYACTELLLTQYGSEIVEKHSEIKRLAEMVTLIYATFASLARSSRSYCIGLKLADYEMLIASTIALNARDRIKELSMEIEHGPFLTSDVNYQRISKQLLQSKGYFSENPLKFNY